MPALRRFWRRPPCAAKRARSDRRGGPILPKTGQKWPRLGPFGRPEGVKMAPKNGPKPSVGHGPRAGRGEFWRLFGPSPKSRPRQAPKATGRRWRRPEKSPKLSRDRLAARVRRTVLGHFWGHFGVRRRAEGSKGRRFWASFWGQNLMAPGCRFSALRADFRPLAATLFGKKRCCSREKGSFSPGYSNAF